MSQKMIAVLMACTALAGCTMGPDFKTPAAPTVSGLSGEPLKDAAGLHWQAGQDIAADWWRIFRSPQLDALIKDALAHNPDVQAAQASLRVAMENVRAQQGAFYPAVSAGLSGSRNQQSAQLSPALASPALLYNLYQSQLSVSWSPDIWGANRRTVEALQAQADGQRYQLQSAYVGLASNLVAAAIQEASLREQIAATEELVADQRQVLDIENRQNDLGQISRQDVAAQETVLAQTEALLPPLHKQLQQQRDLLTVLAGHYPADPVPQTFQMREFASPQDLPLTVPARLVRQRADVRMSEETMHAASAQLGVAIANTLPNIVLTADAGAVSTQLGQMFGAGTGFWAFGGSLTQPIFDGGTLLHRKRAAEATLDQASSLYRGTVLRAFQDVADTLAAVQNDVAAEQSAEAAEKAASKNLSLAREQEAVGQISRLALISAQTSYAQTKLAVITAHANRLADIAALFQALGGGWWNRPMDIAADAARPQSEN